MEMSAWLHLSGFVSCLNWHTMSCPSILSLKSEQKALINPLFPSAQLLHFGHPQTSFPLSNLEACNPVEAVPTSLIPSSGVAVQLNKFKELDQQVEVIRNYVVLFLWTQSNRIIKYNRFIE